MKLLSFFFRIAGGNSRSIVTVYPVPANQQVTISVTGNELLHPKAVLIDRSGRPVKRVYFSNQKTLFSLNDLPAGLYFLQLANGQTVKIMRQH